MAAETQLNVKINGSNNTKGAFDEAISSAKSLAGVLGLGLGFNELKNGVVAALEAFGDLQATQAQTAAVLESTGGKAGVTAQMVEELGQSYSNTTQFSDDMVMKAENLELTFTNIAKSVFPQATGAILDMSQAMGQDLQSTTIQVGKALQDPILGVTALRRVGVQLNDTQQEMVKGFVNTGQSAKAQQVILAELNKEFGGSAEAYGKTLPGQMKILQNSFEQVKEKAGGLIAGALQPLLTVAVQFVNSHQEMIVALGGAAVAVVTLAGVLYGLTTVIGLLEVEMLPVIGMWLAFAAVVGVAAYGAIEKVMANMKTMNAGLTDNKKATTDATNNTTELTKAQNKLGEQLDQIAKDVAKENESFTTNLAEMIKSHQDKVDELKRQLEEENATFTDNEEDKRKKFQETLDDMNKSHERFLEDNKQAVTDENQTYAEAYQKKLDDYTKKINLERQAGTEVSQLKVQDLQAAEAQELADLTESHTKKLASLGQALSREQEDYNLSLTRKQEQYQEDTANAQAEHTKKVTDTNTSLTTEQNILAKHADEVAAVRGIMLDDEITKLEKAHKETLQKYDDQVTKAKTAAGDQALSLPTALGSPETQAAIGTAGGKLGEGMMTGFKEAFMKTWNDFKTQWMDGIKGLESLVKTGSVTGDIKGTNWLDSIKGFFTDNFKNPFAQGQAGGGYIGAGQTSLVNENGKEYFTPSVSGFITPADQAGGSQVTNVIINGDLVVDSEQRKNQLISEISFLMGRQGVQATNGTI